MVKYFEKLGITGKALLEIAERLEYKFVASDKTIVEAD